MAYYLTIATIGAVVAASLAVLARLNLYYLMGLVPLFPAFALIAHATAAASGETVNMRTAAIFGLYALIPYASYLLAIIALSHAWPAPVAILAGLVAWFAIAFALVTAWNAGLLPGRVA